MTQHNLGPNGAIMTSLNLFVTKFDQVVSILERRAFGEEEEEDGNNGDGGDGGEADGVGNDRTKGEEDDENDEDDGDEAAQKKKEKILDYVLVDTPGQIEAFSWSASGTIISESLASTFPTVLAYVIDTPRCAGSPHTFMSNMLYACSMTYRTRLPLVVVFNKTDVVPSDFAEEWMTDYDSFQVAMDDLAASTDGGGGYYYSLTRSLAQVLDEFYAT